MKNLRSRFVVVLFASFVWVVPSFAGALPAAEKKDLYQFLYQLNQPSAEDKLSEQDLSELTLLEQAKDWFTAHQLTWDATDSEQSASVRSVVRGVASQIQDEWTMGEEWSRGLHDGDASDMNEFFESLGISIDPLLKVFENLSWKDLLSFRVSGRVPRALVDLEFAKKSVVLKNIKLAPVGTLLRKRQLYFIRFNATEVDSFLPQNPLRPFEMRYLLSEGARIQKFCAGPSRFDGKDLNNLLVVSRVKFLDLSSIVISEVTMEDLAELKIIMPFTVTKKIAMPSIKGNYLSSVQYLEAFLSDPDQRLLRYKDFMPVQHLNGALSLDFLHKSLKLLLFSGKLDEVDLSDFPLSAHSGWTHIIEEDLRNLSAILVKVKKVNLERSWNFHCEHSYQGFTELLNSTSSSVEDLSLDFGENFKNSISGQDPAFLGFRAALVNNKKLKRLKLRNTSLSTDIDQKWIKAIIDLVKNSQVLEELDLTGDALFRGQTIDEQIFSSLARAIAQSASLKVVRLGGNFFTDIESLAIDDYRSTDLLNLIEGNPNRKFKGQIFF